MCAIGFLTWIPSEGRNKMTTAQRSAARFRASCQHCPAFDAALGVEIEEDVVPTLLDKPFLDGDRLGLVDA
jgi:hypothetical protein